MDSAHSPTTPDAHGYRRLADFMAWDPTAAIFHRFRAANALNLLMLQADVCRLQEELFILIQNEGHNDGEHEKPPRFTWSAFEANDDEGNEEVCRKIAEFQKALKRYNYAILQQTALHAQASPSRADLLNLQRWLRDVYHGGSELHGPGSDTWFVSADGGEAELVGIWPTPTTTDWFTKRLFGMFPVFSSVFRNLPLKKHSFPARVPPWLQPSSRSTPTPTLSNPSCAAYATTSGPSLTHAPAARSLASTSSPAPVTIQLPADSDFVIFSSAAMIQRVADGLATIACCLLLTVPVIAMSYIDSLQWRLVTLVTSTLIFASALQLIASGGSTGAAILRKDVFAVTAAFMAVQVVFLGTAGAR